MPDPFRCDLHIHSVLSPCGELEMSPRAVAETARTAGLRILALCDHNASENVPAYQASGREEGLTVLAGIEITSAEEAHVLGIFDDPHDLTELQAEIYRTLPGKNNPDKFGMQVMVNEEEEVLGFNEHLLIGATTLSLEKVVDLIHAHRGLAVASHVDRQGFSIPGQLGFIPPGLRLDAVEISPRISEEKACAAVPDCLRFPRLCSSDAHRLSEIGNGWTDMLLDKPTVAEIRLALAGEQGRKVVALGRREPSSP